MVYPVLLPLMRTPRLPVVDWTDAPADLNGLVRFAERRILVSARVPSHFKRSLQWRGLIRHSQADNSTAGFRNVGLGKTSMTESVEIPVAFTAIHTLQTHLDPPRSGHIVWTVWAECLYICDGCLCSLTHSRKHIPQKIYKVSLFFWNMRLC